MYVFLCSSCFILNSINVKTETRKWSRLSHMWRTHQLQAPLGGQSFSLLLSFSCLCGSILTVLFACSRSFRPSLRLLLTIFLWCHTSYPTGSKRMSLKTKTKHIDCSPNQWNNRLCSYRCLYWSQHWLFLSWVVRSSWFTNDFRTYRFVLLTVFLRWNNLQVKLYATVLLIMANCRRLIM